MATSPARVGEVRFKQETVAGEAIGTASTFWASAPKKVRAWDFAPLVRTNSEEDPSLSMRAFEDPPKILLEKMIGLSFKTHLRGLNQTAASGTPVTQEDLGLILKAALGGESLGTTNTVAGANVGLGRTAPVTLVAVTGLNIGDNVYFVATNEARRITNIAGVTVTLDMDLSSAPTSGLCVAGATYYPDQDLIADISAAGHLTLASLFRGYHSEDQHQVRGCVPEIELENIGAKKAPQLSVGLKGMAGEMVTGVAVGTIFAQLNPPPQVGGGLYYTTSATRRYLNTPSLDIKLGLKLEAIESPSGEQGIAGYISGGGRTTIEFETEYADEFRTAFEAKTRFNMGYQMGRCSTTAGCVFISFGSAYHSEAPERIGSGITFSKAKCKMHADEASAGATDLALSRFSITMFPHL